MSVQNNIFEFLMGTRKQLDTVDFPPQGNTPKALFLCSTGLLRSPTAASVFTQPPYGWNTRSAGVSVEYALIPVTLPLLFWADKVILMEREHKDALSRIFSTRVEKLEKEKGGDFFNILDIPDDFAYIDKELVTLLRARVDALDLF
jgi:predicted protein tyrosine phosphatase